MQRNYAELYARMVVSGRLADRSVPKIMRTSSIVQTCEETGPVMRAKTRTSVYTIGVMPIPHTGLDKLPSVLAEIESGVADGPHIGAQIYVSDGDGVVANGAIGWARRGVEMRPDTINLWLSSGKPLTAIAVALLNERGQIDIGAPVSYYIPEFAENGKQDITVRHVLTHTGGFLVAEAADRHGSHEEIVAAICASPIAEGWTPGERAAYQPSAGWHILGEIVSKIGGRPVEQFTSEEILRPLGIEDASLKWTEGDRVALDQRWAPMHAVLGDGRLEPHPSFAIEKMGEFARPGSSFRSPASSLGRLYEMLLNGGELGGTRILSEQAVARLTARQREGLVDETFGMKMDWGLGVIPDNKRYGPAVPYGYGPNASEASFGHGGSQSSIGFADPGYGLAVAVVFNGMPSHPQHDRRMRQTLAALYGDLGLA